MIDEPTLFPVPGARDGFAPLGEQSDIRYFAARPRSILNAPGATGMGFWSINPYVGCAFGCAYCYARYAHRYAATRADAVTGSAESAFRESLDAMPAWMAFERRILVKREAGTIVRRELGRGRYVRALQRETIVIGTATDPYQPAERRFRVTRGVLEVLAEQRGLRITIITKSPLITRDLDLLLRLAVRSRLTVHVSLITVDRELARRLEPRAPTPEARLRAIARLRAAGIEVGINCMPVLPGITDAPAQVEALVARLAAADASYIGACALRLRATARQRYLPFIAAEFPELASRYATAFAGGHQLGARYRDGLRQRFRAVCARHGIPFGAPRHDDADGSDDDAGDAADLDAGAPQPSLFDALS